MPISRGDYEAGTFQTALEDQILNLLQNNPGMAYNVADIIEALGIRTGKGFFDDLASNIAVGQSLNFLVQQKKIGSRLIRGVLFYSSP
jgi:hypothetical protein